MAGKRNINVALSKEWVKKEDEEGTDRISDDQWLKEWTECKDVKEEVKLNNTFHSQKAKLIAIKEEKCENDSALEGEKDESLVLSRLKTSTVSKVIEAKSRYKRQVNSLIEKLCQNEPTSDYVQNLCQFKCKECGKLAISWSALTFHVRKNHKNTKVKMTNLAMLKSKVVSHICKVCMEPTLCDFAFIVRHIKNHQLNVNRYVEMFKLSLERNQKGASLIENDSIGNNCVYKCNICGDEFNLKGSFTYHQWKLHKRKIISSEGLVKIVHHKCKLCGVSILCEKQNLHQHFRKKHDISLEEYCKLSVCNLSEDKSYRFPIKLLNTYKVSKTIGNHCEFTCTSCKKVFHCSRKLKRHAKKQHQGVPQTLISCITKGCSYKCKLCQRLLLCDSATINAHMSYRHGQSSVKRKIDYNELYESFLNATPASSKIWHKSSIPSCLIPVHEITSKIGNLCVYKCQKCDRNNFNTWASFRYHYKKEHSKSITFRPTLVVTARYHSCLVCPKAILNDRHFIAKHLQQKHKMKLSTYQNTFQRNGGEVLPTMTEWLKCREIN